MTKGSSENFVSGYANLSELIDFYSPRNHQKTMVFQGRKKLILKFEDFPRFLKKSKSV